MASKVLLGVVALAAVVGSPFAYNHFKSPSGETQKEVEKSNNEQPGAAEKSVKAAPEVAENVQEADAQVPGKNGAAQSPQTDPCNLGGAQTWSATGSPISDKSLCVKGEVESRRQAS